MIAQAIFKKRKPMRAKMNLKNQQAQIYFQNNRDSIEPENNHIRNNKMSVNTAQYIRLANTEQSDEGVRATVGAKKSWIKHNSNSGSMTNSTMTAMTKSKELIWDKQDPLQPFRSKVNVKQINFGSISKN